MSLSWLVTNFIAAFLLPPLNLLMLGALGLLLLQRKRALGKTLIALSLAGFWLLSTPYLAGLLLDSLKPAALPLTGKEADAIVVLGGGRNKNSLEFGGDTLSHFTLERVRYGARLARALHKPVLVTGGAPDGGTPEAALMRDALLQEFGVPTRWVEDASNNTRENALYSAQLLKKAQIRRIYLVTHAWHLTRAVPEFAAQGLVVVPAGTGYNLPNNPTPLDFLPNAKALMNSSFAMHEWIGLLWYRIRH